MLRTIRRAGLELLQNFGVSRVLADSRWRKNRLLILCYHGIAQNDEHLWRPRLYMQPEVFRQRLELLKRNGCSVLPLGDALRRLRTGELPPQSVVITVDDGGYDFYAAAFPLIEAFQFPVTVYQTTYYSDYQRPIFNLVCSYILWKRRDRILQDGRELGLAGPLDLRTEASRSQIVRRLVLNAGAENLTGVEKNELAARLARLLDISYDEIVATRMFQLMNPSERSKLAAAGVDFQLHTHRHRTPIDEELFRKEIEDNRRALGPLGEKAIHFCYPSGVYRPEFLSWLQMDHVVSATTCDPGLASKNSNLLLLPRLVDTSARSAIEFEAWLSGMAFLLAVRRTARTVVPAAAGSASQVNN
jgi:peptidoglycan/xylan/chitin deacetylase (PgdA/CDA1 family)